MDLDDREDLDLDALADAAGVTPRTVRYYVQQGLLPSPGTRGPKTRYDRGLLDRLQLIKRLQRQHLPLSEIRHQLESLDDEGVRGALGALPELPLKDSALGYVRSVMEKSEPRHRKRVAEPQAGLFEKDSAAGSGRYAAKSTWERIPLARDIELHVRRPLTREQNKLVDRLLDAAKNILAEDL
jgi:DNA-binding transcriptional MerR regulator